MKHTVNSFPLLFTFISLLFIGACSKEDDYSGLKVKTYDESSPIYSSVLMMGEDLGGCGNVSEVGFCWNTKGNPTGKDFKVVGEHTHECLIFGELTNLKAHTTYYARAYARHGNRTNYGNVISFTTEYFIGTSVSESSITSTSATVEGFADAGSVSEVGISWSKECYPNALGCGNSTNVPCDYHADGTFSADLTGLEPNTRYYVVAYVVNEEGFIYGNNVYDFTTMN